MKNAIIVFNLILFTLLFSSCDKDENLVERTMEITIISPTSETELSLDETLSIRATISANFELHGYSWKIYPFNNQNNVIAENNKHTHGELISVDDEWENTSIEGKDLILEFTAVADHSGENNKKEFVQFVVK